MYTPGGGGYFHMHIGYSLNKKEWICSLFKEWILEKSEIRVNLEWIWSEHLCYSLILEWPRRDHSGITQGFRVIPEVTPKWVNNTNVHSKFTLISLFSKIHSLKSEHIHSFLFREYVPQERPPFSALNFRSGAYHFHKLQTEKIRSGASPFYIFLADFAVPETIIFKISLISTRSSPPTAGSARTAAPRVSGRSGDSHFQAFGSAAG